MRAQLLGGLVWMVPRGWGRWPEEHRAAYLGVVDGPVCESAAADVLAGLCRAGFEVSL